MNASYNVLFTFHKDRFWSTLVKFVNSAKNLVGDGKIWVGIRDMFMLIAVCKDCEDLRRSVLYKLYYKKCAFNKYTVYTIYI